MTAGLALAFFAAVSCSREVDSEAFFRKATIAHEEGRYQEAVERMSEAIERSEREGRDASHIAILHVYRGLSNTKNGDFLKAIADYREALRLDADTPHANGNLAWIYATARDEAVRDGSKGLHHIEIELAQWDDENVPHLLDTVAAIYAEMGDFDKAVEMEERAISVAEEGNGAALERMKLRLALYRSRKPYRE